MALPSFLPFRFQPSSISPLLKFHSSLVIQISCYFFFLLFSLISLPFSFFATVPSLVPLALLIGDRDYLPSNISLFLPFRHIFYAFIVSASMFRSRNRFDHPLSFLSAPLITPEMIFFCAPLYIYAPFVASFRTFLLRSFAFVMTGITNILNFLLRLVHVSYTRSLVFDYAFYNLLKIFNFFKIKFFKSNERKIIYLERLLYRTMAFSV